MTHLIDYSAAWFKELADDIDAAARDLLANARTIPNAKLKSTILHTYAEQLRKLED